MAESAVQPLLAATDNFGNTTSWNDESPLSIAFHTTYFAFNGLLLVYIQVMYPDTPTAFETHYVNMITSLISLCVYACGIMSRLIVKVEDFTYFVTVFNYAIFFSGILTPVSLLSVFLPYKSLLLVFFICALFSIILAHYFFKKIKVAVDTMFAHLNDLALGAVDVFNGLSSGTYASAGISAHGDIEMPNIPPSSTA